MMIGVVSCPLVFLFLFSSSSILCFLFLSRLAIIFLLLTTVCFWVYSLFNSFLRPYTLSRQALDSFFSKLSPFLLKRPAATITLIASQTLLLMFLESLDSLEKLSMRILLTLVYFNLLFLSNSLISLFEMNLRPFTSSMSPSLSSSKPPLSTPWSSVRTTSRGWVKGGMIQCYTPLINLKIINIILGAQMLQRNFKSFSPHLEGSRVEISTSHNQITTLGSDGVLFTIDNDMEHTSCQQIIHKIEESQITAFAIHPQMPNSYVIGNSLGFVRFLRPMHKHQIQKGELIFKGSKPITHLTFSPSGRYLGISSEESSAVLYSFKSKKLVKLPKEHEGYVTKSSFCNERHIFTIGNDGKLHLYSIKSSKEDTKIEQQQSESEDPFEEYFEDIEVSGIDEYKIAHESISRKYPFLNACFSQLQAQGKTSQVILCSGQIFMTVIEISQMATTYQIDRGIKEDSQILLTQILGNGKNNKAITFVVITQSHMSFWNYNRHEKLLSINLQEELNGMMVTVVRSIGIKDSPSFTFLVNNLEFDGKVYFFTNYELIDVDLKESVQMQELQPIEEKKKMEEEEESEQQPRGISFASQLLPHYPQFPLQKGYDEYYKAKFLFYNNIGCIIQRINQDSSSTLQLQLHDKSQPKRYKLDKNKSFGMFALKQTCFLCATTNSILFQYEESTSKKMNIWQQSWENIQGVAIGNNWVAACSTEQIKIFDFGGNQIHSICFDRRFVCMEAYQDLLAIVYHSSLPVWGCQVLKMRIFRINEDVTVDRDVPVVLKTNSILKWFGFSEEGMIYCQDTLQNIRSYSFNKNQWQNIFNLDEKHECLFIQHVQGSNIYGFRLEHTQNEKQYPKVLPRSLPRKISMVYNKISLQFLSEDQQIHLNKLMLKNYLIEHEEYRHYNWYKYKYSRKSDHPWYQQSKTVLPEQQIKTMKMQLDLQLHDYLKKFLGRNSFKKSDYSRIAMSLLLICERQAHYEETKDKLKNLLTVEQSFLPPRYLSDIQIHPTPHKNHCKQKMNEISILEQMINLIQ